MSISIADRRNPSRQATVNEDGSLNMVIVGGSGFNPRTENFRGSAVIASVLTLSNTDTSSQESIVINGVTQTVVIDYTISHSASLSKITFITQIVDGDYISVRYFI